MRNKCGQIGMAVLGLAVTAGCSVGEGSPDGWRYLMAGSVAVAHPKGWQESPAGVVLRGADGRTDAALAVAGGGAESVPADARREVLEIDGSRARVLSYAAPAPDGRPAGHVEVRALDRAGRTVVVRAWAVDGTGGDPSLLREIVNSIEFTSRRPR